MLDSNDFDALRVHILASLRRLEDEMKLVREAQMRQAESIASLRTISGLIGAIAGALVAAVIAAFSTN